MRKLRPEHQVTHPRPHNQKAVGPRFSPGSFGLQNLLRHLGTPQLPRAELLSLKCGLQAGRKPPEFACKTSCILLGEHPWGFRGLHALSKMNTFCTPYFSEKEAERQAGCHGYPASVMQAWPRSSTESPLLFLIPFVGEYVCR